MVTKIKVGFRELSSAVVAEISYEVTGEEVNPESVLFQAEALAIKAQSMATSMTMRKRR